MAVATFGGYNNVTEIVTAAAKTQILANIALFRALVGKRGPGSAGIGTPMPSPDFDHIPPQLADQLNNELDAWTTALNAAPVA